MFRSVFLVAAMLLSTTAVAQVSRDTVVGVSRDTLVWAGPDDIYPRVASVRRGERVWLHGCLRQHAWCDVSTDRGAYAVRGWVPGHVLFVPWRDQGYAIGSHGMWQHFPMSDFVLSVYWGNHYSQRPWYRERHRFGRHDWRRDQWRWDRNDRNWNDHDGYHQRIIEERRRQEQMRQGGRDRDGLTPLQRQIQLQAARARQLQLQREREARARQDSAHSRIDRTPVLRPMPTQQATPLQKRIEDNASRSREIRTHRQVEP